MPIKDPSEFTESETNAALIGIFDGLIQRMEARDDGAYLDAQKIICDFIVPPDPGKLLAIMIWLRNGTMLESRIAAVRERLASIHGALIPFGVTSESAFQACQQVGELIDELDDGSEDAPDES